MNEKTKTATTKKKGKNYLFSTFLSLASLTLLSILKYADNVPLSIYKNTRRNRDIEIMWKFLEAAQNLLRASFAKIKLICESDLIAICFL